ncbi:hypothetical protein CDAR_287721 [Caerostris darwini]|uniref:Uncharacterized protein n=1 Tax=Caerostris darwini TaxID=1538125 RepID=A0AAV4NCP2_9ARAC|nr:hypothetical protein CDAR_287721 [Caerostris darwini]
MTWNGEGNKTCFMVRGQKGKDLVGSRVLSISCISSAADPILCLPLLPELEIVEGENVLFPTPIPLFITMINATETFPDSKEDINMRPHDAKVNDDGNNGHHKVLEGTAR